MAKKLQILRGTTAQNDAYTGSVGELTMDTEKVEVRIHDGTTQGGKTIGITSEQLKTNQITNCITEIPQDIKLELNNGNVTLKSGSKIYVPNGFEADGTTLKFDVVTVQDDVVTTVSYNGTCTLYYAPTTNQCFLVNSQVDMSGTTDPTTTANFYNTQQNLIKRFDGSVLSYSGWSFPLCRCATTTDGVSSIDVVFNGFGYIGPTIFALPGVKGLIPDGRNEDGTLNNTEFVSTNVVVRTLSFSVLKYLGFNGTSIGLSDVSVSGYDKLTNTNYSSTSRWDFCLAGVVNNGKGIFSIKQPFAATDFNDTEHMAHQAMPSNNYIDLTLGGNWAQYQAPADGYYFLQKDSNNALETIRIIKDGYIGVVATAPTSGFGTFAYMPVSKGEKIQIAYTVTGVTKFFRFVYANGAQ